MSPDGLTWTQRAKTAARRMRRETFALYLAMRHPRTPVVAKLLAALVVVYALSPIDLIPDPIPVLGYLDDLLLVPLGILAVRWMIPDAILAECRRQADEVTIPPRWRFAGGAIVVAIWLACLVGIVAWLA